MHYPGPGGASKGQAWTPHRSSSRARLRTAFITFSVHCVFHIAIVRRLSAPLPSLPGFGEETGACRFWALSPGHAGGVLRGGSWLLFVLHVGWHRPGRACWVRASRGNTPFICAHRGMEGRDAPEGKAPQRRPQRWLGRRLEEVAEAVGGGYCRLQIPLSLVLGVRGTVAGRRLGALEAGGGPPPPFQCIPDGGSSGCWGGPPTVVSRSDASLFGGGGGVIVLEYLLNTHVSVPYPLPPGQGWGKIGLRPRGVTDVHFPPPPPFWPAVTRTPDGPTAVVRGGPVAPQHIWLKMIPTMR